MLTYAFILLCGNNMVSYIEMFEKGSHSFTT